MTTTPSLPQAVLTAKALKAVVVEAFVSTNQCTREFAESMYSDQRPAFEALALALSRMGGESVAAGWAMVPLAPTPIMVERALYANVRGDIQVGEACAIYNAMLAAAPTAPAQQAAPEPVREGAQIAIDFKQAAALLEIFGGEPSEITLGMGDAEFHSGPGLYAWHTEYPEDGAHFLGKTDGDARPRPSQPKTREAGCLRCGTCAATGERVVAPGQPSAPTESELFALLPYAYYMDPPDGGDVPLLEQLRRMSEDAAKWRAQQAADVQGEPEKATPEGYTQSVIDALYESGDPVSVDAAEELQRLLTLAAAAQSVPKGGADLRAAAQAVIDRWDSPKWKDEAPTAEFINRLRTALAASAPTVGGGVPSDAVVAWYNPENPNSVISAAQYPHLLPKNKAGYLPCFLAHDPVDVVLHCPACGLQHIDAPDERTPGWNNEPHRSHLCHGCNHIWRPADVPTNGVKAVKTTGKADSRLAAQEPSAAAEPVAALDDLTALLVRLHPEDSAHEPSISHLVGKLRAAITSPPTPPSAPAGAGEGDSYEDIWNALQRIEAAAVSLPWFRVVHEGGIEACAKNIVLAIVSAPPSHEGEDARDAARDVLAERKRQITAEGWTPAHDDAHKAGELSSAAACYVLNAATWLRHKQASRSDYRGLSPINWTNWPWAEKWWKPKSERVDLVRAGALILAEIERLDRAARAGGSQ